MPDTTTTTAAAGRPLRLSPSYERSLLARGEPGATPRRRAELHGLEIRAYLAQVYDYTPGPIARARPPRLTLRAALARRRAP